MQLKRLTAWVVLLFTAATALGGHAIQLNVPNAPPAGTNTLTGSFQGYSMEIASFAHIAGNIS